MPVFIKYSKVLLGRLRSLSAKFTIPTVSAHNVAAAQVGVSLLVITVTSKLVEVDVLSGRDA